MKSGYKQTQVGVIPEKWKIGGPGTGNTFWQYVLTTPKTSQTTPIAGYRSAFTRTASEQHARRGLSSCSRIPQQPAPSKVIQPTIEAVIVDEFRRDTADLLKGSSRIPLATPSSEACPQGVRANQPCEALAKHPLPAKELPVPALTHRRWKEGAG